MNNSNIKTVAIIGAGPAGLCSIKSALENGLKPTAFEKELDIGGLWSPSHGNMWDNMTTNVSKYVMCFSDYPYQDEHHHGDKDKISTIDNTFPSYKTVYNYLNGYTDKFNLRKYIKFNTTVKLVEKVIQENGNYKFKITYKQDKDSELNSTIFDFVIISSGNFSKPQECSLVDDELKNFRGRITHSKDYKNNDLYVNKKVVVVGTSISGCEISSEVSKVTSKLINVGHDNSWVYDKWLPINNKEIGKLVPWDSMLYTRNTSYEIYNKPLNEFRELKKKYNVLFCPKQIKEITPTTKIPVLLDDVDNSKFALSSNYINQVENGSITVYTGNKFKIHSSLYDIEKGNCLTFKNNLGEIYTEEGIDEIILCTGYQPDLSYLEKSIDFKPKDSIQPVCLYRNIFAPNLKNISFISFFRGLFIAEVELLSRWSCMVFSGKLDYPNHHQFKNGVKNRQQNSTAIITSPNNNNNIITIPNFILSGSTIHCDSIANEMGILPNWDELKENDYELYDILWNGYFTPATYRLVGHGSNPTIAKQIIRDVNKAYKKLYIINFVN